MSDKVAVKATEGSPEYVAYKLLFDIAAIEGGLKDRKTILDTYAECLHATNGYRDWQKR